MLPLAAIASLTFSCQLAPSPSESPWVRLAREYREAQAIADRDSHAEISVIHRDIARFEAVKTALAQSQGPTKTEVLTLLRSTDVTCQDLVLPLVISKRLVDEEILVAILEGYRAGSPYYVKGDTFVYFSSVLDAKQRIDHFCLIRPILCNETDSSLLTIGLFHIVEFEPEQSAELFTCYLKHDSDTLRKLTYSQVKVTGMLSMVRERLRREHAQNALDFLRDIEASDTAKHQSSHPSQGAQSGQ